MKLTQQQATSNKQHGVLVSRVTCHVSRRAGFSLVELVISMAILSVGLVGALRVFPVGLRASHRSEMNSRATMVAQRTIESMKLKTWGELADGDTTTQDDTFEVTTRISPSSIEPLADPDRIKKIEVAVQWSQDGRPRSLIFVTYLRRNTS